MRFTMANSSSTSTGSSTNIASGSSACAGNEITCSPNSRQRPLVLVMLLHRQTRIDRLPRIQVSSQASRQRRAYRACQRNRH